MAFKIYTKTGDTGETGLFGGRRVLKNDVRVEAYGTVDELNSYIGLLRDRLMILTKKDTPHDYRAVLKTIQDKLFTIGALLATDPDKKMTTPDLTNSDIQLLENEIDTMELCLPALKNFILPGGHETVSFCNIARTVCRRAERRVVDLIYFEKTQIEIAATDPLSILSENEGEKDDFSEKIVLKYLNRLSDYLFVLGRKIGQDAGAEEVIWKS